MCHDTAETHRRSFGRIHASFAASVAAPGAAAPIEPPELTAAVADGKLPPVNERLPETPGVVDLSGAGQSIGAHGGTLNILMGRAKDIRMMMVYGYARLVGYNPDLEFESDLLGRFEVEAGRVFTFTLRKGHKWSDGAPFTVEDFRYYYEDVVNNLDLSPFGPPPTLLVDGEAPRFEILDAHRVRYSWSKPNPSFLPAIAGARPLFLYRPAHYLKQFHARYVDEAELAKKVEAAAKRNWAGLHHRNGPSVSARQCRSAEPAALDEYHQAAFGSLRVSTQSLLPPGRSGGPPATVYRQGDRQPSRAAA